ncbi:MAG: zinc ribbon domain-containing protein [Chloroflexota bacterium]|nr:zinc ribbon domain-containing protein [Chloroflexota bacterium]
MNCPKCGQRARQGDAFCAHCGAPIYGERSGRALSGRDGMAGGGAAAMAMPGGVPVWRPVSERESRNWAVGAHVSALVGGFLGGVPAFVGPLVVLLLRRRDDAFAAAHARAAFNFHFSVLIYAGALVVLTILTFGLGVLLTIPAGGLLALLWLVFTIVGALRASDDRLYRYPLAIPFLR